MGRLGRRALARCLADSMPATLMVSELYDAAVKGGHLSADLEADVQAVLDVVNVPRDERHKNIVSVLFHEEQLHQQAASEEVTDDADQD